MKRLSHALLAMLARLAPARWRESIAGDFEEERQVRLLAGGRPRDASLAWQAARVLVRLWVEELTIARRPRRRRMAMNSVAVHLSHAVRALTRRPAYALVTILTLAIGIGANAAVFGLANWLMFRPIPAVQAQDRLVTIRFVHPSGGIFAMSHPEIDAVRDLVPALSGAAGSMEASLHVAPGTAAPERLAGEIVSANYFDVLGVSMFRGRPFSPAEPGVIISYQYWQTRLGGRPDVTTDTLLVNGRPQPVLGVTPPGFTGPSRSSVVDLWAPSTLRIAIFPGYRDDPVKDIRAGIYFTMIGRLATDGTIASVRSALERVPAALAPRHPRPQRYTSNRFIAEPGLSAPAYERGRLATTFSLLMAMGALLLLLTCANAGNVMLASGAARQGELAMRQALGASRRRIAAGALTESALLAAAGGAVAVGLASTVTAFLRGTLVLPYLTPLGEVALDRRVLAFALGVSSAALLGAGLLPALAAVRFDPAAALKGGGRTIGGSGLRLRRILMMAQVAVSLTLLIGALLLARSLHERRRVDPGFNVAPLLTFSVEPGLHSRDEGRLRAFYADLVVRLTAIPGVQNAALGWSRPFDRMADDTEVRAEGSAATAMISAEEYAVGPRYFETMGIAVLEGRGFMETDLPADDDALEGPVIVSAALARRLFGGASAVGRTLQVSYPEGARRVIIGVVADARLRQAFQPPADAVYSPLPLGPRGATVHVSAAAPLPVLAPALREAVRHADPALPLYDLMTARDAMSQQMAEDMLVGRLALAFAALATLLAAVGLYGVLAQAVAERRIELGVRAALGAAPSRILVMVAGDALGVTLAGAAAGLAASFWLTRYLDNWLFGVGRFDTLAIGTAMALVISASLAACVVPALRAARIDPVAALRR